MLEAKALLRGTSTGKAGGFRNQRENPQKSHDFCGYLELVAGLEPATC